MKNFRASGVVENALGGLVSAGLIRVSQVVPGPVAVRSAFATVAILAVWFAIYVNRAKRPSIIDDGHLLHIYGYRSRTIAKVVATSFVLSAIVMWSITTLPHHEPVKQAGTDQSPRDVLVTNSDCDAQEPPPSASRQASRPLSASGVRRQVAHAQVLTATGRSVRDSRERDVNTTAKSTDRRNVFAPRSNARRTETNENTASNDESSQTNQKKHADPPLEVVRGQIRQRSNIETGPDTPRSHPSDPADPSYYARSPVAATAQFVIIDGFSCIRLIFRNDGEVPHILASISARTREHGLLSFPPNGSRVDAILYDRTRIDVELSQILAMHDIWINISPPFVIDAGGASSIVMRFVDTSSGRVLPTVWVDETTLDLQLNIVGTAPLVPQIAPPAF